MTVEELREVISDHWGITADRKKGFHPEIIKGVIELAFNQVIFDLYMSGASKNDYSQLDAYIHPYYNVPVLCNEETDEYYSELPAAVIQLPMSRGIHSISLMKDRKVSFMFRANGESEIYENISGYSETNTIPTYEVQNWHVRYSRMTKEIAKEGVLMRLIPCFREWGDKDIIPAPSSKSMDIVQAVENMLNAKWLEQNSPTGRTELPEQTKQ